MRGDEMDAGTPLRSPIGAQAEELGHRVYVVHVGKRFRMACSCGWGTPSNWKRRTQINAAMDHASEVVRTERPGVSEPETVRPPV